MMKWVKPFRRGMVWHGIVPLMATTEINHLTTIKMPTIASQLT